MTVRAKVKLNEITSHAWNPNVKTFRFSAVCDDGTPENQKFQKYTPSGSIELMVDNPAVEAQFSLGGEFYVDFEPVPTVGDQS